jgi:hypothetical protein
LGENSADLVTLTEIHKIDTWMMADMPAGPAPITQIRGAAVMVPAIDIYGSFSFEACCGQSYDHYVRQFSPIFFKKMKLSCRIIFLNKIAAFCAYW